MGEESLFRNQGLDRIAFTSELLVFKITREIEKQSKSIKEKKIGTMKSCFMDNIDERRHCDSRYIAIKRAHGATVEENMMF